jgi:hypothetical protein
MNTRVTTPAERSQNSSSVDCRPPVVNDELVMITADQTDAIAIESSFALASKAVAVNPLTPIATGAPASDNWRVSATAREGDLAEHLI